MFYDNDGQVVTSHVVDFELEQHGPVGLFTYRNMEITTGPNKGQKYPNAVSYIFRVGGDTFTEVNGLLDGEAGPGDLRLWKRVDPRP